jgi:hypothetical protein
MNNTTCARGIQQDFRDIIEHLTPTTLAALSVELRDAECLMIGGRRFLDLVDYELVSIVGEEEAEQHREWVRASVFQ